MGWGAVHLDDPNEEITEQWQDGLHEWYIRRDDQCSVKPNRIPRDVSEMRGYPGFCSCLKRRSVSVRTNSKVSTPRERDSHSASRGPVAVLPQKPSVVAWFQRCFCVPHLFGLTSSRKVDSANRTHIPTISGIAANGSGVVDKIAKTTRMMCWYLLMVGITFCLDRAVHVPHGADACLTNSSFVDTFHVDPWNSRDNLEQRVQRRVRRNRVDLVQVGGQVTNPEDRDTAVRLRGYKTRHVEPHRLATVSDRAWWRAKLEECWRPITLKLVVQNKKSQSLLAYVADLARDQHRRGGRVFLTFPWPIQSVINEAPFLFAREKKRGILTNCVDTARLIGRSRCCKSLSCLNVWCSRHSRTWLSPMRCICGTFQFKKTQWTIVTLSTMKRRQPFRQKRTKRCVSGDKNFLSKRDVQSFESTPTLVIAKNSTLAKMISDAGGSEEMIKCATRYPCSVCKRMSRPRLRRPVSVPRTRQFNDTLLADVHFCNCQGREVLVYSVIDEATRFHVTQIVPSQSARDLYEAIMNAWVKWAGAPRFLLVDPHRSHLARQFIEQLGAQGTTVLVGAAEASWTRGLVERHGAYVRSMVEKMVHDGVPDDMSVQSLFDKATSAKNMMSRIRGYSPSQWVLATQPRIPESLKIDDEDEDHVPHKDIPEGQDDEFARSVRVRDAARRAFIAVDTDQRLRRAAISASRPDRLTFESGDLCYFWRNGLGWSPGMATVVSQVGQGHYYVDYGGRIFKQAAEQLSHVTERERLAQEAVRESRDSDRDMDHVSDEPELPSQPSQFPEQRPNVDAPVHLISKKHLTTMLTTVIMKNGYRLSLLHKAAVHTGNGDQSTKCLLQNLLILE